MLCNNATAESFCYKLFTLLICRWIILKLILNCRKLHLFSWPTNHESQNDRMYERTVSFILRVTPSSYVVYGKKRLFIAPNHLEMNKVIEFSCESGQILVLKFVFLRFAGMTIFPFTFHPQWRLAHFACKANN